MHRFIGSIALVAAVAAAGIIAAAQQAGNRPLRAEEAAAISQLWALIGEGQAAQAAARAAQLLQANPRSAAALSLAIEAQIGAGGASAALKQYEQWLGARAWEEPLVLRRVSHAILREEAAQKQDPAARLEAVRALAEERDPEIQAEIAGAARQGSRGEIRVLAALGDEGAVKTLLAELKAGLSEPVGTIHVLAQSGSRLAVGAIVERLGDRRPEVRGAAVEGLAKIGGADQIARLKPMLQDPSGYVRAQAAAALYQLNDDSGAALLREMAASEAVPTRLIAAQALASRPDAAWQALVRELTEAKEPEIQVAAATLLAPHDPERAQQILERLAAHENLAIRELAVRTAPDVAAGDLSTLRKLMRSTDHLTRVRAAARLLALTR